MIYFLKSRDRRRVCSLPLWCVLLILSSCMTERAKPLAAVPSVPKQTIYMVKKIDYDTYGRPLFREKLGTRPDRSGEQFTLVHAVNGRVVRSYDIAIIEQQHADMSKPLAIVYDWTGKGFRAGLDISGRFAGSFYGSGEEAAVYLAIITAPIIIGGVSGFVVGIVSSIPETAGELRRVIVNSREMVMGYTVYEYDETGRIRYMKLYPPEEHTGELVKTEFHYAEESSVPSKTEVTSRVEHMIRVVH
jgi:hypothetical protein